MVRLSLLLNALAFGGFGLWGIASPDTLIASIEFEPTSNGALTEIRAMYGGLELGIAAAFVVAAVTRQRHALVFAAMAFGGFAIGRGTGMLIHGAHGLHPYLMSVETVAAATNALVWWWAGQRAQPGASAPSA